MKLKTFISALALMLPATMLLAQHSDIELGYDSTSSPTAFVLENDDVTSEGIQIWESEFERDPSLPAGTDDFGSNEPGFATAGDEGLLLNAGDEIFLTALDASVHSGLGVGYVNFFNPTTGMLEASGRLAINDNGGGTTDLILDGASVESGDIKQFIDIADSAGDIHDHVVLDLLDDDTAPAGAYGILFQLESDFATADGTTDLTSDSFWIVWNHKMDNGAFRNDALLAFGFTAVPEPGSATVLSILAGALILRRRRNA